MQQEHEFSFKDLFVPLTTLKAIHWIILIGIVVFANMLFNKFVWDDITYIISNPEIYKINIPLYFQKTLFNVNDQYRVLTELYFSILYSVFTTNPHFYHIVQLLLHISITILVFFLMKRFFTPVLALLLSLIFLVHPMQVESVSYIASAGGMLFLFFGLIGLVFMSEKTITNIQWIVISLLFLLSLLTKESGLLILISAVVYVALFNSKQTAKAIVVAICSLFTYLVIRFGIGEIYFIGRPLAPIAHLSMSQRVLNIPVILFYYIKTFIYPMNLFIDQQWAYTRFTLSNFYIPLFVLSITFIPLFFYIAKLLLRKQQEGKVYLFFLLWTVIGFGMYSQLITLDRTVADRWMYFPMVGLLGLIGSLITFIPVISKGIKLITFLLILVICLLSIRTIIRNTNWYDNLTLYNHDTKYYTNYIIENDYAQYFIDIKDYKDALIHQKRSVDSFPYEQNVLNLGRAYELSGNLKEAEKYYTLAFHTNSYFLWNHKHIIHTYIHLAKVLIIEGNATEAVKILTEGLDDYKNDAMYTQSMPAFWLLLVIANAQAGNHQAAVDAAWQAHLALPNAAGLYDLYNKLLNNEHVNIQPYLASVLI